MSDPARPQPAARSGSRQLVFLGLLTVVVAVSGYYFARSTPGQRVPGNDLALQVAGGWWNITGDRYLDLEWEGRRAVLWDYSSSETGVTSTGIWSATQTTLTVHVSGAAGELVQEYEMVGNDVEAFLAPVPASTARLVDCWIADHGDEEEDLPPAGPLPQEARRPPRSSSIAASVFTQPARLR